MPTQLNTSLEVRNYLLSSDRNQSGDMARNILGIYCVQPSQKLGVAVVVCG